MHFSWCTNSRVFGLVYNIYIFVSSVLIMSVLKLNDLFYKRPNLLYPFCRHRFWVYLKQWVQLLKTILCASRQVWIWQISFFFLFLFLFLVLSILFHFWLHTDSSCSKSGGYKTYWNPANRNHSWAVRINPWCLPIGWLQFCRLRWTKLQKWIGIKSITNDWRLQSETWRYDFH